MDTETASINGVVNSKPDSAPAVVWGAMFLKLAQLAPGAFADGFAGRRRRAGLTFPAQQTGGRRFPEGRTASSKTENGRAGDCRAGQQTENNGGFD